MNKMQWVLYHKQGNITIILLGLVSVMLIMVFALSRRMSGHTQLLTLSDQTQISRYILESYVGDVLQQLKASADEPNSDNFNAFRDSARNKRISTKFYSPSTMLYKLKDDYNVELLLPPEIIFSQIEELKYPQGFDCPNNLKGKEKKGLLEIVCKIKFHGRQYTLRVQYPFKVVFRLTPILKDFVLFVDRIGREQKNEKIGPEDNLNIMYTKNGNHPLIIDSDVMGKFRQPHRRLKPAEKYRPWIIQSPLDATEFSNPALSGKVYLGPSDEAIYLNLAGDNRDKAEASMGELFLVSPETFSVANKNTTFEHIGIFMNKSGDFVKMLGMNIPLKHKHIAKMGIMGFSYEMVPELGSLFRGTAYQPADFFNSGSSSSEFYQRLENYGSGYMALASGLKLMGLKTPNGSLPAREIYGNVFLRFFVLTFWWPPSGGGEPLKFDEYRGANDFPSREVFGVTTYHFEPEDPSQRYQDFMSRMASGRTWRPRLGQMPDGFIPYNIDTKVTTGRQTRKIYNYLDFTANDGFKAKAALDSLGRKWYGISDPKTRTEKTGCEQRVGQVFDSGDEFLKAAGIDMKEFNVNGVIYVSGKLSVPPLTMSNDKIRGGVVMVDGPIELNNITRGYKIDTTTLDIGKVANEYAKWRKEITQENFLTFVSLSGDPIILKGEILLGVHLINLTDAYGYPYNQIMWSSDVNKEILFCGGIACNYLNLPERLLEFGRIKSACPLTQAPFFLYHSAMAADKPALAVQIMKKMRGYRMTAGKAQ